jgi:hypothetical protein
VGAFVVVRPKSAWDDTRDPLNRPIHNLRVEHGTSAGVLLGLRDFLYTGRFATLDKPGNRFVAALEVQSGTVIDALNQLTRSADAVLWNAAYRPHAQSGQRYPKADLQLQFWDADHIRGYSESTPSEVVTPSHASKWNAVAQPRPHLRPR